MALPAKTRHNEGASRRCPNEPRFKAQRSVMSMSFRIASQVRVFRPIFLVLFSTAAIFASATAAFAENEGQDDLDKATEKKLAADSLQDLDDVINLCDTAIQKGLDPTNTTFANNLLVSTLMQRAGFQARRIPEQPPAAQERLRVL